MDKSIAFFIKIMHITYLPIFSSSVKFLFTNATVSMSEMCGIAFPLATLPQM